MDDLTNILPTSSDDLTPSTYSDDEYGGWNEGEDEAKVSGDLLPQFGYYVFRAEAGDAAFSKQKKTPSARGRFRVVEGPDGTIGATIFDDLFLSVNKDEATDETDAAGKPVYAPKDKETYDKHVEGFQKRLNKIARVLGFSIKRPINKSPQAVKQYAQQFANQATFIAEARVQKGQGDYPARNKIVWDSLRAFNDLAHDKKLKGQGVSAHEEAQLRIAEKSKQGKKDSNTAGPLKRSTTAEELGVS